MGWILYAPLTIQRSGTAEQRLALLNLANECLQTGKQRGVVLSTWEGALPNAIHTAYTGHNGAIAGHVRKLVEVWRQRQVVSVGRW